MVNVNPHKLVTNRAQHITQKLNCVRLHKVKHAKYESCRETNDFFSKQVIDPVPCSSLNTAHEAKDILVLQVIIIT